MKQKTLNTTVSESKNKNKEWYVSSIDQDYIFILDADDLYIAEIVSKDGQGRFVRSYKQRLKNAELAASAPTLLAALEYYQKGIDHFYKCINFGASNLDATAIEFMNQSNLKIKGAIAKATNNQ